MLADPDLAPGAHDHEIQRQSSEGEVLHRESIDEPTPVFGTGQPPHGASGYLRRAAYEVPEHYARHWMLLLVADRLEIVEDRLGDVLAGPLERAGYDDPARRVRANPLAALAGIAVGLWLAKKVL
jgi:hypothetical protein